MFVICYILGLSGCLDWLLVDFVLLWVCYLVLLLGWLFVSLLLVGLFAFSVLFLGWWVCLGLVRCGVVNSVVFM